MDQIQAEIEAIRSPIEVLRTERDTLTARSWYCQKISHYCPLPACWRGGINNCQFINL